MSCSCNSNPSFIFPSIFFFDGRLLKGRFSLTLKNPPAPDPDDASHTSDTPDLLNDFDRRGLEKRPKRNAEQDDRSRVLGRRAEGWRLFSTSSASTFPNIRMNRHTGQCSLL